MLYYVTLAAVAAAEAVAHAAHAAAWRLSVLIIMQMILQSP